MEGGVLHWCCSSGWCCSSVKLCFHEKKVQFLLTSCEFGSVSKYSSISLDILFLSLHQSADLILCEVVSCFELG